jgi:hypothetical protein
MTVYEIAILHRCIEGIIQDMTTGGGDDPKVKMQAVIEDILAASPEGVETNGLIDAIQRAHPEIDVPEIIDFMQSGAMDISADEITGNWHLEEDTPIDNACPKRTVYGRLAAMGIDNLIEEVWARTEGNVPEDVRRSLCFKLEA